MRRTQNRPPARQRRSERRELASQRLLAASREGSVREIRFAFGVSRKTFARLGSFSERAVAAWESGEKPGAQSRQQMAQLERLHQALAEIIEPKSIGLWIETPNPAFEGLKPLEVIERGQVDRIWRMIFELQSGTPG